MARSKSKHKKENKEVKNNPLIDPFWDTAQQFFDDLYSVSEVWDDSASDSFRFEITEHSRQKTEDYLNSVNEVYTYYNILLESTDQLTNWEAGFGGKLSLLDIGMLAERQMSRLLFNRDDQRF